MNRIGLFLITFCFANSAWAQSSDFQMRDQWLRSSMLNHSEHLWKNVFDNPEFQSMIQTATQKALEKGVLGAVETKLFGEYIESAKNHTRRLGLDIHFPNDTTPLEQARFLAGILSEIHDLDAEMNADNYTGQSLDLDIHYERNQDVRDYLNQVYGAVSSNPADPNAPSLFDSKKMGESLQTAPTVVVRPQFSISQDQVEFSEPIPAGSKFSSAGFHDDHYRVVFQKPDGNFVFVKVSEEASSEIKKEWETGARPGLSFASANGQLQKFELQFPPRLTSASDYMKDGILFVKNDQNTYFNDFKAAAHAHQISQDSDINPEWLTNLSKAYTGDPALAVQSFLMVDDRLRTDFMTNVSRALARQARLEAQAAEKERKEQEKREKEAVEEILKELSMEAPTCPHDALIML